MKKYLLLSTLFLSACSQLADNRATTSPTTNAPVPLNIEEVQEVGIENSEVAESVAMDFELIFIDNDMSFIGTLPCANCEGVKYHINLYRDGRFEARQEYLGTHRVNLVKGIWLLENRTLHLVNQQITLPAFHFLSNQTITMLDMSNHPIVSTDKYQLQRQTQFAKLDSNQAMLGLYQVVNNQASFTHCMTGERFSIANTQHHLPMMRQYQHNKELAGKEVLTSFVARQGQDEQANTLFIDKFEQFWPGVVCPSELQPGKIQGVIWKAEKLNNKTLPQDSNIRAIFEPNGRLYGSAGCNNYNSSYKQFSNVITINAVARTRKACGNQIDALEHEYVQTLQSADRAEVNGKALQMYKDNKVILQFKPATN